MTNKTIGIAYMNGVDTSLIERIEGHFHQEGINFSNFNNAPTDMQPIAAAGMAVSEGKIDKIIAICFSGNTACGISQAIGISCHKVTTVEEVDNTKQSITLGVNLINEETIIKIITKYIS